MLMKPYFWLFCCKIGTLHLIAQNVSSVINYSGVYSWNFISFRQITARLLTRVCLTEFFFLFLSNAMDLSGNCIELRTLIFFVSDKILNAVIDYIDMVKSYHMGCQLLKFEYGIVKSIRVQILDLFWQTLSCSCPFIPYGSTQASK